MGKISSYKKSYYVGCTFLIIMAGLLIYFLSYVSKHWSTSNTKQIASDSFINQPDTVYQEKIVETHKIDTLKIYIPIKPTKSEIKDTTTTPSSSVLNQSQN